MSDGTHNPFEHMYILGWDQCDVCHRRIKDGTGWSDGTQVVCDDCYYRDAKPSDPNEKVQE